MYRLEKTSAALYDLMGDNTRQFGQHLRTDIVVGQPGINVGETRFDPTLHEVGAVNPIALTPMMLDTDMPYVNLRIPYRPVELNVVIDDNSGLEIKHEWIKPLAKYRAKIGAELVSSIEDSKQPDDSVKLFVVGNPSEASIYDRTAKIVETKTADESAAVAAEICSKGISIVISNFENFPIDQKEDIDFRQIVGVKANHPRDIVYLPNTGTWTLGGLKEVNTDNQKDLRKVNEKLLAKHNGIIQKLGSKGMHLAKVVYDERFKDGIDIPYVDKELSKAILGLSLA